MGRGVLIITEWSIIIPNWHLTLEQNEATKSIQNMPSSCVGCVWTWKDHYICGATCYRNIARLCSCHAMWWAAGPFLPVSALLCCASLAFHAVQALHCQPRRQVIEAISVLESKDQPKHSVLCCVYFDRAVTIFTCSALPKRIHFASPGFKVTSSCLLRWFIQMWTTHDDCSYKYVFFGRLNFIWCMRLFLF